MTEKEDHIKKMFNSKLSNFEPKVPDGLWAKIDESLSKQEVSKPATKIIPMRFISVAVGVAAVLVLFFALNIGEETQHQIEQHIVSSGTDRVTKEDNKNERVSDNIEEQQLEDARSLLNRQPAKSLMAAIQTQSRADRFLSPDGIIPQDVDYLSISQKSKAGDEHLTALSANKKMTQAEIERKMAAYSSQIEVLPQSLSNEDGNGLSLAFSGRSNVALYSDVAKGKASGASYHLPQLYSKKEEVIMKHDQPVSFGLTVSKKITPRLQVETGVVYTYLSAKVESNPTDALRINDTQSFHYFGVPLSLSYRFADVKKFKFYISGGAMIQKDFYGFHKGKRSVADLEDLYPSGNTSIRNEISQDNPQFSINSTLGAAYPIYKELHIYGTVGVAYYFDANNKYKTIYTDRKTQLDLNLGLRYEF